MIKSKRLLTTREACEYLGVCRTTLHTLVKRRELPVVRITARPRFRLHDLERLIERRLVRR